MSRTWTRRERREAIRSKRGGRHETGYVDLPEAKPEPATITPEWAIETMSPAISFRVNNMIDEGYIGISDAEDYLNVFTQAIVDAVPRYDPTRTNEHGRTSSARHFLEVVLVNRVRKTIESIAVAKRIGRMLPILVDDPGCDDDCEDYKEDPWTSDRGRSIESLFWRMDMESMTARLPKKAATALAMILAGHELVAVADALGMTRFRLGSHVLPVIRKELLEGGYGPRKMVDEIFYKKVRTFSR